VCVYVCRGVRVYVRDVKLSVYMLRVRLWLVEVRLCMCM